MSEVSIIMPAFNAEATIGQSIESVQEQTFQNWSLLVVDTGSGDQTAAIVRSYADSDSRLRYFRLDQPAKPGFRLSLPDASAYVAFIRPGDSWTPEKLDTQLGQLTECGADGVFCNSEAPGSSLQGKRYAGETGLLTILEGPRIEASAVLLNRPAYELGGGFPLARPDAAYGFWLRLLQSGCSLQGFAARMMQGVKPAPGGEPEYELLQDIVSLRAVSALSGAAEDARRRRVIERYRKLFDVLAADGRKGAIREQIPGLNATLGNPRIGSALANLLFLPAGLFRRFSSWLLGSLMK